MSVSRVTIIGGPGSGKTWLSWQVSRKLSLPVYSVDEAVWASDGSPRPAKEIDALLREQISKEQWIIEGGNTRTYEERALRSHLIIRLNPPLWLRFIRVIRRNGVKPSLLFWTLKYDKIFGVKDQALLVSMTDTADCFELRSAGDCEAFLGKLHRDSRH